MLLSTIAMGNPSYTNKDERYMELAIREAYKSEMYTRHGCVIVVNGKVIGRGFNNYRNQFKDPLITSGCSCHAEMDALRNAFRNKKCFDTAYNTAINHKRHRSRCRRQGRHHQALTKTFKINIYVACIMPDGQLHNSSPCTDCFNSFNELEHTIKYIVYTKKTSRKKPYGIEKIHFRDYQPSFVTSGRSYINAKTI